MASSVFHVRPWRRAYASLAEAAYHRESLPKLREAVPASEPSVVPLRHSPSLTLVSLCLETGQAVRRELTALTFPLKCRPSPTPDGPHSSSLPSLVGWFSRDEGGGGG